MLSEMHAIIALAALALSCSARQAADSSSELSSPAPPAHTASPGAEPEPKETPTASTVETPTAAPSPPSARTFPPPDIPPPFERSAAEGDGVWKPLGVARAHDGAPLLYTTVLHPHEASKFITLTLVAVDLSATRLSFLPGTDDVGERKVPFSPGLVPAAERERLIAAFNGGFMPRHGRWGMRVGETTILPPREPGCTVAIANDHSVRIRSWPALAPLEAELRVLRQTPPCLIEQGAVHADLLRNQAKAWAGQTPGIVTRRRSAVGLSADGRVLYYAVGVETPPKLLAMGLSAAGAHDAAQLDINWNWTRFFLFDKAPDGRFAVSASLVDVQHAKREYVERASERDFFYVLRAEP
jgi:hypothetical protein